jgi:hypothetical protein
MDKWLVGKVFLVHPENHKFAELGEASGFGFPLTSTRSIFRPLVLLIFALVFVASFTASQTNGFGEISFPVLVILIFFALLGFNFLKDLFFGTFGKPIDATLHAVQVRYEVRRGKAFKGWKMDVHYEFSTSDDNRLEKIEVIRFADYYSFPVSPGAMMEPPPSILSDYDSDRRRQIQHAFDTLLRENRPKVRVQYVNSQFFRAL